MEKVKVKSTAFDVIVDLITWFIFAVAVVVAFLAIVASFSGEQDAKEFFGVKMFIVQSDSMSKSSLSEEETIYFNAGDLIIIKPINEKSTLTVGDVITFISFDSDSYGKTITHKIRDVKHNSAGNLIGYVTYGINTGINDKTIVPPDSVIGKYVGKISKLGLLFAFTKTPQGYFLSILIPLILLIVFFSAKIGKVIAKKQVVTEYEDRIETLIEKFTKLECFIETALTKSDVNCEENNFKKLKKTSFAKKLLRLDSNIKTYFNILHNELVSYKNVNDRLSQKCMSYRLGRKLIAKMTVRGKTLNLHLAIDTANFDKKVYFQKNFADKKAYLEVPFTVKVKSDRGVNNAVKLISALMLNSEVQKKKNTIEVNGIKMLSNINRKRK